MRVLFALLAGAVLTVSAGAVVADRGPGVIPQRQGDAQVYRIADFDRLVLATGGTLDVRVGPAFTVQATGPAAALEQLRVVMEKGALRIERRDSAEPSAEQAVLERQVRVSVTLPRLAGVTLGGAGQIAVDRIAGGDFDATLGGSGRIGLGRLEVGRARITIGGSGDVTAAGRADSIAVTVGGSGRLDAPGLRAGRAAITSVGTGSIRASIDGPASVSVIGSGSIDLGANARCAVTRQGTGTVRCGS